MTPFRPRRRRAGLLRQEVDGETLLYDQERHRGICLDRRAEGIRALCNGERDAEEIAALLRRGGARLSPEVVALTLRRLSAAGLLEPLPPAATAGISRRALIRQLGWAAIPVVLFITAPEARASASCAQIGQACMGVNDCCPGLTCGPGPNGLQCGP